jgi:hypothetical protein
MQQSRDLLMEYGNVGLDYLPNSNIVDKVVTMNKQVAKGDDSATVGYGACCGRIDLGDATKSFSNYFEVPLDGRLEQPIAFVFG